MFRVRNGCARMSFIVWGTEGRSVPCVCSMRHHIANHSLHEYVHNFVAAYNSRASAALCELALVISLCRTDQFSRSFLPVTVRL